MWRHNIIYVRAGTHAVSPYRLPYNSGNEGGVRRKTLAAVTHRAGVHGVYFIFKKIFLFFFLIFERLLFESILYELYSDTEINAQRIKLSNDFEIELIIRFIGYTKKKKQIYMIIFLRLII